MKTEIEKITLNSSNMTIFWGDKTSKDYDYLWLRDNCLSAFHPQTQERQFDLLSISEDIRPLNYKINPDSLTIIWSEKNHESSYSVAWLRGYQQQKNYQDEFLMMPRAILWRNDIALSSHNYQSLMQDDDSLYDWMKSLAQYGLCLVNQMPDVTDAVESVAERIGHLRRTNFGITFDVQSKPNPNNQAYTADRLPLHTDLPNQETPPGYQFLHCLVNDSTGGESVFVDGFSVAEELRKNHEQHFHLLSTHKIPFRFHDDTCDIREMRPVISLVDGVVNEIIFNAHIAGVFHLPDEIIRPYYLAYRAFMKLLNDERFLIQTKLNGGQMVVFDNPRVLHGRNSFNPQSGNRHLRGCYVDRTEFKSKYRMLSSQRK